MKSDELMIGDWILLKSVDYADGVIRYVEEKKRVHVDILSRLEKQETKVVRDDCVYSIQVEPIELTREILEKNGWKYENYANEYSTESEEYFVYEDFDIYINNDGKFQITSMDTININLDYVHQLQHALKLCGINKTIEL